MSLIKISTLSKEIQQKSQLIISNYNEEDEVYIPVKIVDINIVETFEQFIDIFNFCNFLIIEYSLKFLLFVLNNISKCKIYLKNLNNCYCKILLNQLQTFYSFEIIVRFNKNPKQNVLRQISRVVNSNGFKATYRYKNSPDKYVQLDIKINSQNTLSLLDSYKYANHNCKNNFRDYNSILLNKTELINFLKNYQQYYNFNEMYQKIMEKYLTHLIEMKDINCYQIKFINKFSKVSKQQSINTIKQKNNKYQYSDEIYNFEQNYLNQINLKNNRKYKVKNYSSSLN